jgi:hypothetical protein
LIVANRNTLTRAVAFSTPMDLAEARRRQRYTSPGSIVDRALCGVIAYGENWAATEKALTEKHTVVVAAAYAVNVQLGKRLRLMIALAVAGWVTALVLAAALVLCH